MINSTENDHHWTLSQSLQFLAFGVRAPPSFTLSCPPAILPNFFRCARALSLESCDHVSFFRSEAWYTPDFLQLFLQAPAGSLSYFYSILTATAAMAGLLPYLLRHVHCQYHSSKFTATASSQDSLSVSLQQVQCHCKYSRFNATASIAGSMPLQVYQV